MEHRDSEEEVCPDEPQKSEDDPDNEESTDGWYRERNGPWRKRGSSLVLRLLKVSAKASGKSGFIINRVW